MKTDLETLIRLRHWLHAHPEVSRHEVETAKHMRRFLDEHSKPDRIVRLHGAGFAAVYDGLTPGKTVMLRCELDALPIHEINTDLPHRSKYDGVGHKCGHDGHMTILAGVALRLANRPTAGRVVLLFQPDEETGAGALASATHENFAQIQPDFVFALHNLPGFPQGEVICRHGTFASHVKYVAIKLAGKEAHSAQPETGASPSFALAELTMKARNIQASYDKAEHYALAVPVFCQMGGQASGICPARGEVHYTLRAAQSETVEAMWNELRGHAQSAADQYGLTVGFETKEEFSATANSELAFDLIQQASEQSGLNFNHCKQPFRWGEDFGELTKRYQGGMFGLGAGQKKPDLHNPDYDFPDEILESGIAMFTELTKIALSR